MTPEKNKIYSGTVKNIKPYGAFVEISDPTNPEDKLTGMVHISEVANEYVNDINDVLTVGQEVNIIVLGEREGKYSFSIKKANKLSSNNNNSRSHSQSSYSHSHGNKKTKTGNNSRLEKAVYAGESGDPSFEAMMSRFKKISDDKMSDINRIRDRRNKSYRSK